MLVWTALKGEKKVSKLNWCADFLAPSLTSLSLKNWELNGAVALGGILKSCLVLQKFVQNYLQSTLAHLTRFQRGWSCYVFFSKKSPTRFILSIKRAKNNVGTKVSFIFFCTSFKVLQLAWVVLHKCTC